ncbi:MAG TPA: MFS transporter [Candidatus Limnocylindrales bacterium]|nr:MFS transporter [Candidatus Limnocylindrales bacterium]
MNRSLTAVLVGTFTLRFSTGLTGAMLAFYLAHLTEFHPDSATVTPVMVGLFSALFFVAELALSPLFGILGDRYGHHRVMLLGPAFGAVAVLLTALSGHVLVLGATRLLEGSSTAASVPAILGYIAIVTANSEALRGRAASRFEGATLAGIGLGFIVGPLLFGALGPWAFVLNAVFYLGSLAIYAFWVRDPAGEAEAASREHVSLERYAQLIGHSHVWLLAPTWIAVNAAIGLWFSQSLFQLARPNTKFPEQWLHHGFAPGEITAGAIVIAIVFGAGILWWGNRFDRYRRTSIIGVGVFGGLALVIAGVIANHAARHADGNPVLVGLLGVALVIAAIGLFALAGATPAAVGLLADVSEQFPGDRGAIMGLYSVFLGIGQILGSLIGGVAAEWRGFDGLFLATGVLLLIALIPLSQLRRVEHYVTGPTSVAELA